MSNKSKVVITYGTFDLFHYGHLNLLNRLRALGDYLIVAVSTDEFNLQKGKKAVFPYQERVEIIESLRIVDQVIPETSWEQKLNDIHRHGVSVFGMGSDWEGKFDYLRELCEVVYLSRTEGVSSTEIRRGLNCIDESNIEEMRKTIKAFQSSLKGLE